MSPKKQQFKQSSFLNTHENIYQNIYKTTRPWNTLPFTNMKLADFAEYRATIEQEQNMGKKETRLNSSFIISLCLCSLQLGWFGLAAFRLFTQLFRVPTKTSLHRFPDIFRLSRSFWKKLFDPKIKVICKIRVWM